MIRDLALDESTTEKQQEFTPVEPTRIQKAVDTIFTGSDGIILFFQCWIQILVAEHQQNLNSSKHEKPHSLKKLDCLSSLLTRCWARKWSTLEVTCCSEAKGFDTIDMRNILP
jgi:hypothetical protein